MFCGPLYLDSMIQHIILPQIGLGHVKIQNNATQGGNIALEAQYRKTIVFGPHEPKYVTTSDWFGP